MDHTNLKLLVLRQTHMEVASVQRTTVKFKSKDESTVWVYTWMLPFQCTIRFPVCKAANFDLRKTASVRPFMGKNATVGSSLNSRSLSRLDYCSPVLAAPPSEELSRLQRILNHTARLVYLSLTNPVVTTSPSFPSTSLAFCGMRNRG